MFAASLLYLWAAFPAQVPDTKPPPKRPNERFTVYVEIVPRFDSTSGDSADKVLRSVSGRIKKRRTWFFVTEDSAKAEVRVEVFGHRVRQGAQEHHREPSSAPRSTGGERRVRVRGAADVDVRARRGYYLPPGD